MKNESLGVTAHILAEPNAIGDESAKGRSYKWYILGLLVLGSVMNTVDRAVISVVVEPLKAEFHLADKQIGMLHMAFGVTCAAALLPMGWLIDRVNRRVLLSVAITAWSVLTALSAFASNFATLLVARMGVGIGEAPGPPASLSLIADIFPIRQRNTAVSIYFSGSPLGQLLMFIGGGWLLMHFNWRAVFLVAGGPGLVLGALLFFTTREPKRGAFDAPHPQDGKAARDPLKDVFRSIFGNSALCYAILGMTIATGVSYSVVIWTTSFLVRVHGLSVSQGAISTGIGFGLCATIGSLVIGPIADRFSKGNQRKLALIPLVATLVAFLGGMVMVLGDTLGVALAGLAVLALMTAFFASTGYSLIISLADPRYRGTTLALAKLSFTLLGDGPIPLLTGTLSDAIGGPHSLRPAFLCTMTLSLAATFCYARVHKIVRGRENPAAASLAAT